MSSESVYQVALSCVDVGSFHKRLLVKFMSVTASVRNAFHTHTYMSKPTVTSCQLFALSFCGVGSGRT
jgi:hypothetical protein